MASPQPPSLVLHGWCRSSCAGRLRISLGLKSLPYEQTSIDLSKNEQFAPKYTSVNPSRSVPTLSVTPAQPAQPFLITQSVAALEFIEEAFPESTSLLPPASDPAARARVRTLANVIACDVQPVTGLRVLHAVEKLGDDGNRWAQEWMARGFEAYEALVKQTAGKYSYGDSITLADVCMVPAVWNLERWGVDVSRFPTVKRIHEELMKNEAIYRAHPSRQFDTPDDLKATDWAC